MASEQEVERLEDAWANLRRAKLMHAIHKVVPRLLKRADRSLRRKGMYGAWAIILFVPNEVDLKPFGGQSETKKYEEYVTGCVLEVLREHGVSEPVKVYTSILSPHPFIDVNISRPHPAATE